MVELPHGNDELDTAPLDGDLAVAPSSESLTGRGDVGAGVQPVIIGERVFEKLLEPLLVEVGEIRRVEAGVLGDNVARHHTEFFPLGK